MNGYLDQFGFFRPQFATPEPLTDDRIQAAKVTLKERGWSYRAVAKYLGYGYTHIAHTLTGRRQSRRLLNAIANLPHYSTIHKKEGK